MADTPTQEDDYYKDLEPYFTAIGKLAVAWNRLQDSLALLFTALNDPLPSAIPLAIWHTVKSDRGQREILKAAAVARFAVSDELERFPSALDDITWLINRIEALEDQRNNALHAPLGVGIDPNAKSFAMVPWTMLGNPRATRLKDKQLLPEFSWYLATAEILNRYCQGLHFTLALSASASLYGSPPGRPWPDRPKLPSLVRPPIPKAKRPSAQG